MNRYDVAGADVIASVNPAKADLARSLGASDTVDRTGDIAAAARWRPTAPVEVLVDLVGPAAWAGRSVPHDAEGGSSRRCRSGFPDESLGLDSTVIGVQLDRRGWPTSRPSSPPVTSSSIADLVPLSDGPAQFAAAPQVDSQAGSCSRPAGDNYVHAGLWSGCSA